MAVVAGLAAADHAVAAALGDAGGAAAVAALNVAVVAALAGADEAVAVVAGLAPTDEQDGRGPRASGRAAGRDGIVDAALEQCDDGEGNAARDHGSRAGECSARDCRLLPYTAYTAERTPAAVCERLLALVGARGEP